MAVDYFLKVEGIEGESTDESHAGEIEISEFTWSESQSGTFSQGGGGGIGKVRMNDFVFNMRVGKASPKFMLACAKGDHIPSVTLTCRKAGGGQQEFYKITMSDVLVSHYETSSQPNVGGAGANGLDDGVPRDNVKLNFAKIESEYRPQKSDGSLENPITVGYDLKKNQPV